MVMASTSTVDCRPSTSTLGDVLVELMDPDQHFPSPGAFGRPQDSRLVELVDDPRRATIPDLHAPLQQGSRSAEILDADLRGLAEEGVALPWLGGSAVLVALRLLRPDDLEDVILVPSGRGGFRFPALEPRHQLLGLLRRDV